MYEIDFFLAAKGDSVSVRFRLPYQILILLRRTNAISDFLAGARFGEVKEGALERD